MEKSVISLNLESSPINYNGLLLSKYKEIVKSNYKNAASKGLFGVRQRVKSFRFATASSMVFVLRLFVFAFLLLVIF